MYDLGEIRGRLVLDDDFSSVINGAATKLETAALSAQRVGRRFEEAGRLITLGFTIPVTAAATAAITMSNNFESTITKLVTISNVGAEELEMMRKAALDLAPAVGQGPQALADALVIITSTGFSGATALEILERSAKAAAIGLGQTKDIARAVTSAMRAYGEDVLSAERATDILLTTVRKGGAEADEVAESLGRVVGIAAKVGVSFEELGAFVATFTRLGIDADEAVTALRGTLSVLLKPAAQTRDMLAAINMPIEELRKNVKEKGLTEALIELIAATKGNEDAIGRIIPNVRALAGVLGTAGVQAEGLRENLQANIDSVGELDRAFEIAAKTGAFRWSVVVARLKTEFTEFGDVLVKAGVLDTAINLFDKLIDVMSDVTRAFGNLSKPTQEFILIATAALVALGPLIRIFGSVVRIVAYIGEAIGGFVGSAAVQSFIGWLSRSVALLVEFALESRAVGSIIAGLASGPFAAFVAASTAIITATRLITGSWDFLIVPLQTAWGIFKDLTLIVYDLAVIFGKELLTFLSDAWNFTTRWTETLGDLFTIAKDIVDPFNTWEIALALIRSHITWMINNAKIAGAVIGGLAAATGMVSGRVPALPNLPASPFAGLLEPPKLPPMFTGKIPLPGGGGEGGGLGLPDKDELRRLKEMEELYDRINTVTVDLTEAQKENVLWLLKRKVSEADVAKLLGITAVQLRDVVEEEKILIKTREMSEEAFQDYIKNQVKQADALAKAIVSNHVIRANAEKEAASLRRRMTTNEYDFQRSEIEAWEEDALASVNRFVAGWGTAMDAIHMVATLKYEQAAREASIASMKMATEAANVENAWVDVLENIPNFIQQAFTGGGGIGGALKAVVSDAGSHFGEWFASRSDFGVKIFGKLANGIGKLFGDSIGNAFAMAVPEIGAALGSVVGQAISAIRNINRNITKEAREAFAEEMGFRSLGALYKDLQGLGPAGQELRDIGIGVIGRKDEAANRKWMSDVQKFYEQVTSQVEEFIGRTDVLWNKQIRGFLQTSAAFVENIKTQLTAANTGLAGFLQTGATALTSVKDIRKQMAEVDEKRRDLFSRGIFQGSEVDDLNKQWDELNKTLKEQEGIWNALGLASQASAEAFGGALAGIFAGLLEKGVPILTVVSQLAPGIEAFKQQLLETGFTGGAAFEAIEGMFTIVSDKVAGPVLQGIQQLGGAFVNLHNTGLLNQQMFEALTGQVSKAYDELMALGFDGDQVLRLMQPTLQTIWELQTDFNFAVDEGTQKLIDEALAAGQIGDKFRDPMERMILAMDRVVTLLEKIALKLGALPDEAGRAARGIDTAFSKGTDYEVRIRYKDEQPGVRGSGDSTGENYVEPAGATATTAEYSGGSNITIMALDSQTAAEWLARGNNARTFAEGIVPLIPRVVEYYGEG